MQNDTSNSRSHIDVLGAYRRDLASRGNLPISPHEGEWLQLGSLLAHSAMHSGKAADAAKEEAVKVCRRLLSTAQWDQGNRFDPTVPTEPNALTSRIRTVAEEAESAGAMQLADAILEAFIAAYPNSDALEMGRIEAERARIAWKRGEIELAAARYARTAAMAKAQRSDELRVRALIGQALLARLAGNYPKSLERATTAQRVAERNRFGRLAASALHTMMVAAAVRGEYDNALSYGWRAFIQSKGDTVLESDILGNVGQLFLDMGHPETAIAAFRVVIERPVASRVLLPALGGFAIAAARLAQRENVQVAVERVMTIAAAAGTPYANAVALLELAEAHSILGDSDAALGYQQTALSIAREKAYHELVHRAETFVTPKRPPLHTLQPSQEEIAGAVREMVPA